MNISNFTTSLTQAYSLLASIGILKQKGIKSINNNGVSDEFKSACQKQDYFKTFRIALSNFDYDILLNDQSFFQFSFMDNNESNIPDIRYAYFQNPLEFKTYKEFLGFLRKNDILDDESDEDVGETFLEEYEQFLIEQQLNLSSTTIRFDTDFNNYRPLIHSVSHFHIGYQNNIRIPCDKIISPLKFVLFVLKHIYYDAWKDLVENNKLNILDEIKKSKNACTLIDNKRWVSLERHELYLT